MRDHESEEMYLETILRLSERMQTVRSVDVVEELGYAKSSVSRAVNLLKAQGDIRLDENGGLLLTARGRERANAVYERHRVITAAFVKMGADGETAEQNACRIEHVITEELFSVIKNYTKD